MCPFSLILALLQLLGLGQTPFVQFLLQLMGGGA